MKRIVQSVVTGLVIGFAASTARADLTPEDLWQTMRDGYAQSGMDAQVEGTTRTPDALVVTGATLSWAATSWGGQVEIPLMRFRDLGDGRVELTLADQIDAAFWSLRGKVKGATSQVRLVQSGLRVTASGVPGDLTLDFVAPEMTAALSAPKLIGRDVPARATIRLAGGAGQSRVTTSGVTIKDTSATFDSANFDIATPGGEQRDFKAKGTLNGVTLTTGIQTPAGSLPDTVEAMLKAGFRAEYRLQFASGNITADLFGGKEVTTVQAGLAEGEIASRVAPDGSRVLLASGPSRAVIQVPSLPVPAEIGLDGVRIALAGPMLPAPRAAPFELGTTLDKVTFSEGLWAMADPSQTLPHDPMSLHLDLTGTLRLIGRALGGGKVTATRPPVEVETASLNALKLSALGVDVAGSGTARFLNDGPEPRPVGTADVEITGANALLDRLVAMQLMSQEQATGLRLGLALFTVPKGADGVTSHIEADQGGDVRVNGQVLYRFPNP